jgi:hypothetical protein
MLAESIQALKALKLKRSEGACTAFFHITATIARCAPFSLAPFSRKSVSLARLYVSHLTRLDRCLEYCRGDE